MTNKFLLVLFFSGLTFVGFSFYVLAQACPSQTQYSFNNATLVGEITNTGGENNVQAWFDWGLTSSLGNSTPQQNLYVSSLPYRFCYTLFNLSPCTTYYYRAAVRNSQGVSYGQIYSFTTKCQTPQPSLNISCYALPNPANIGDLVTFYSVVNGGTGYYSYEWIGACNGFSSNCQKNFFSTGNYMATLKVTSGGETKYTTCSVNIIQASQPSSNQPPPTSSNQPPVAIISFSPERIFPGTTVTFDASRSYDPDGYIVSYSWYINDELVSNRLSFIRSLASGNYRLKLIVTDNKNTTSSKEILISVGRNVYLTRTVTKKVPIETTVKLVSSNRLVDILLDHSYKLNKCSSSNIQLTLVNNTSVNRQINISSNGETKNWFEPKKRSFIVEPQSTQLVNWKVNIPCNIEPNIYEFTLKVSTYGEKFDKKGLLEVKTPANPFTLLLGFIKGASIWGNFLNIWIILLLILIFLGYRIYRYFRNKLITFRSSIIQKP